MERIARRWWWAAGFAGALAACGGSGSSTSSPVSAGGGPKPGETMVEQGGTDGEGAAGMPDGGVAMGAVDAGAGGTSADAGMSMPSDPTRGLRCEDAIALTPGVTLNNQDTPGDGVPSTACRPSDAPQRFYSFQLPPGIRATVTVTPAKPFTAVLRVMVACDATECITDQRSPGTGAPVSVVVDSPGDQTVTKIVTVSGLDANDGGTFSIALTFAPLGDGMTGDEDGGMTGGGEDGGMTGGGDGGGMTGDAPAPRPIAPLSTAGVTSHRPTLHWSLPAGVAGAHVEICADRACGTVEASFDAAGTSGSPGSDLAPGAHFWRLRGLDALGRAGAATSATWEFFVGARSAAVDASWGSTPDFNGDGAPDLVGGGSYYDATLMMSVPVWQVFENTGHGLPERPTYSLDLPAGRAVNAGDLNGDGYGDVAVSHPRSVGFGTDVDVYYGGPGHLSASSMTTLPEGDLLLYYFVGSVGDVNGDGYGDVAMPSDHGVATFFGGASGIATTPGSFIPHPAAISGAWSAFRAFSVGDVNADGFADAAVAYHNGDAEASHVFLFLGGPAGLATDGIDLGRFAYWAAAAGADVNADGYADVAVTGPGAGKIALYFGGAAGPSGTPSVTFTPMSTGPDFGSMVPGDFDGDGYGDFASFHYTSGVPHVSVIRGGAGGPTLLPDLVFPETSDDLRVETVAGIGDEDGDGFMDLLANGSVGTVGGHREVGVLRGAPGGLTTTVSTTLTWGDAADHTNNVPLLFTSSY